MAEQLLAVKDLRKTYETGKGAHKRVVEAARGVSFTLDRGGALGIVGESGSGKTTIARILAGLERATSGEIDLLGAGLKESKSRSEERRRRARSIQLVFQDPYTSLDPRQTIGGGLEELQKVHFDRSKEERQVRTDEVLLLVGLASRHRDALPKRLSGGQRQRAAIARALVLEPGILILDEAVSALDVSVQAQILNLLNDLRAEQTLTYILISHDLAVVRQIAKYCLVMYRGSVVEEGLVESILADPLHPYTRRLLSSVPKPGVSFGTGQRVDMRSAPTGACRYLLQCPLAIEQCETAPTLRRAGAHAVACWKAMPDQVVPSTDGT